MPPIQIRKSKISIFNDQNKFRLLWFGISPINRDFRFAPTGLSGLGYYGGYGSVRRQLREFGGPVVGPVHCKSMNLVLRADPVYWAEVLAPRERSEKQVSDQRVLRDGEFSETVLSEMKDLGRKGHALPRKDRGGVQVRSQFWFWAVGGLPNLTVYRLPI